MPCPICNQAALPSWRALMRASVIAVAITAAGCTAKPELPPLPPAADMCSLYSSYRYSPAAAAVESTDALDKHNANEAVFLTRCLIGDRSKSLGPR